MTFATDTVLVLGASAQESATIYSHRRAPVRWRQLLVGQYVVPSVQWLCLSQFQIQYAYVIIWQPPVDEFRLRFCPHHLFTMVDVPTTP